MLLSSVADSRDNNFDVLRLVAASLVLVSHSFFLSGGEDPLYLASGMTFGTLGVALFFAMSGFLILKSWTFQPTVRDFARKRGLRIMPALWVALLLTTFVLGPIVTSHSAGGYLTSLNTWKYVLLGSALITFGGRLPGVFEGNPYPAAVNGSLWTLPIEASAYVMVAVGGTLGLLRRQAMLPFTYVVALAASYGFQHDVPLQNLRLYAYFLAGMMLYAHRNRIRLSWPLAALGFAVWVASFHTDIMVVIGAITLPYGTMVLAYRTPATLRRVTARGDVSYGLYIYAFPVQQTIAMAMGRSVTAWWIMTLAFPVAYALAFASWRLVERPALSLKPAAARPPVVVADAPGTPREPAIELASVPAAPLGL